MVFKVAKYSYLLVMIKVTNIFKETNSSLLAIYGDFVTCFHGMEVDLCISDDIGHRAEVHEIPFYVKILSITSICLEHMKREA